MQHVIQIVFEGSYETSLCPTESHPPFPKFRLLGDRDTTKKLQTFRLCFSLFIHLLCSLLTNVFWWNILKKRRAIWITDMVGALFIVFAFHSSCPEFNIIQPTCLPCEHGTYCKFFQPLLCLG